MPYIKPNNGRREKLQKGETALTAGELNYQIFYYVKHNYYNIDHDYLFEKIYCYISQFLGIIPNYQKYNDMVGCLVLCGKELKRRLGINIKRLLNEIINKYDSEIFAYEDCKILENGDV